MYEASAQAWLQRAEIDSSQRRSAREALEHARDIIDDRALRADPDNARVYTLKSHVLLRWYRTASLAGEGDRRPLLDRIAQAAARAVEIDPEDAHAWTSLGNVHVHRGRHETDNGGQSDPWWNRAFEALGKALALQPNDLRAHNVLGTAHRWRGNSLDRAGRDPMPAYLAALRSYERASAIDPQYLAACISQVDLHTSIAEHNDAIGNDPRSAVDNAQRVGARCLAINPNHRVLLDNLAQAQLALAQYLVEAGRDPRAALASARDHVDRAEGAQPETALVWLRRLTAARIEATFRLRQRDDPTPSVVTGRAALGNVLRLFPNSPDSYVEAARLDLVAAGWAAHTGSAELPLLEQALANAEKAVALPGQLAAASLTAAEACLRVATVRPSRIVVDLGIAHVEQAIARDRRLAKAARVRVALHALRQ